MSSLYTLLALCFLGSVAVTCYPMQKRSIICGDSNTKLNAATIMNMVCQSLWYLEGTIAHCPPRSACNQTAMEGIKSGIQCDLCEWVSKTLCALIMCINKVEIDVNLHIVYIQVAELITVCPAYIPSLNGPALLSNCSKIPLEDICGSIYVKLL